MANGNKPLDEAALRIRFLNVCWSGNPERRAKQVQLADKYYNLAIALLQLGLDERRLELSLTDLEHSMLVALAALS
jgi:hypothetical protein